MQVQTQSILFDHIERIVCVCVCVCVWACVCLCVCVFTWEDEFSC